MPNPASEPTRAAEALVNATAGPGDAWAQVIREASQSGLGIFALMILVLAFLAYAFFRRGPLKAKLFSFLLVFIGVTAWGAAMYIHPQELQARVSAERPKERESLAFSETRALQVCTVNQAWTGWVPAGQTPPDPCRPKGCLLGRLLSRNARITGFPPTPQVNYLFECRRP